MSCLLTTLVGLATIAAAPATELQYFGTLSKLDRSGDSARVKEFDVRCLVTAGDDNQRTVIFLTEESDGAAVAWPERFGRIDYQFEPARQAGTSIFVLYKHDDRPQLLSLPGPIFEQRAQLAANAEWSTDAMRYHVVGSRDVVGRAMWEVDAVSTGRGGSMQVVVDPQTGVIQSGSRKLTMGQGVQFELAWKLESQRELTDEEATRAGATAESLLALQMELGRVDAGAQPVLSPAQLELVGNALSALQQQSAETPFAGLVKLISRDVQSQQQRVASVSELSEKFVGQDAPQVMLSDLNGKPIPADSLKGKTLVLHFWDYRDEPLEEPYGQIAYLDFLMNRHSPESLAVYGVAVDRRLNDPATASQAARSVKRLKSFMNLGYEIAADKDGKLLKAFGDPTQFDAALPLWVVIGPDGKVVHYRTGYYEIDREVGLSEIDAIVSGLEAR
jgi:peroxiredoxin